MFHVAPPSPATSTLPPPSPSPGCKLDVSTTHADCSKLCSNTTGCYAYVFSPPSCDTPAGHNVCWLKSGLSTPTKHACRNYQVIKPILDPPFCPLVTQWGASITNTSTPLPEYPRPQMVRSAGWTNLNGFWEWQPASAGEAPPFGKTLNGSILVPFPTEACLSGVWKNVPRMWYRKVVAAEELRSQAASAAGGRTLLQFGAVDWMATVYVNGALAGNHTGGYSRITMDITAHLPASGSVELIVFVFDPSNFGQQVFGKQRVSAITDAGGDTYTPASGIWQTVWTEQVPSTYISDLKIVADTKQVTVNITTASGASQPRPASECWIDRGVQPDLQSLRCSFFLPPVHPPVRTRVSLQRPQQSPCMTARRSWPPRRDRRRSASRSQIPSSGDRFPPFSIT